ncbi:ABC transporter permease [Streptomyces triticagri]|uniref:Transport permease protein n=1 Tax=Streptomyces triticagri TaxID=2293568 RepID=A0A372LW12_9ACTN|nr:ABC transporter permease [Streptomyces triticagri]RFU82866.1 ABC transporter permease [Streptomyces triticagri]
MSTTLTTGTRPTAAGPTSTPMGRLTSLARAELTLLGRSKGVLFTALAIPLVLPFSVYASAKDSIQDATSLSMSEIILPAAVGFSLLFAVYSALVNVFVVRREELVFKRLRTGELRDGEILAGAALPSLLIGFGQCVLVSVACLTVLDSKAPAGAHLIVLGVLLGLVLAVLAAGVTAALSRTAEGSQVTSLPLVFLSMLGSGMAVPLEALPDKLASVCELLPFSPVIALVRGGLTGELSGTETLVQIGLGVAWIVVAAIAVRRLFRWEPRR